jgi:AraC family ethanolamine operon transcriptional activator
MSGPDLPNRSTDAAAAAATGRFEIDDLCGYETASAPWEVLVEPIGRGPFAHRKDFLISGSLILYREDFEGPIHVRGMSPPGMLAVGLPLRIGERTRYWGASPSGGFLPATLPGALDVVLDAQQEHIVVLVALDLLRRSLPENLVDALERRVLLRRLPVHGSEAAAIARWLLAVIEAAGRQPDPTSLRVLSQTVEDELPWRLARACRLDGMSASPTAGTVRRRALDRAIAFLRESDIAAVDVGDLCRAATVAPRTLEYGFGDELGLSPLKFLRLLRLHRARRELAGAQSESATVADIADRLGLFHHGRFAAEYRQLFGEMPSQTLCRPPLRVASPMLLEKG